MENNENNFQNEVKNVENEVKTAQGEKKTKKNGKAKKVILAILLLVIFLLLGILVGIMIPGNNKPEFIKQIENKITNQENKDSKKIDESKPWVYDADYLNGRTDKTRENYKASRDLIAPFININSDDAQKANEDIKALYEELYGEFTENLEVMNVITQEKVIDGSVYAISKINYEYVVKDNILSILLTYDKGAVPADVGRSYKTYNFNLDTLKFASLEEVGKVCGFNSETEIKEKIKIAMDNAVEDAGIFEDTTWDGKRFFVNKNGKLNIVLPGPALGEITLDVDKNAIKINKPDNKENNPTTENTKASIFEINKNLDYTSNLKDNANGRIAIFKLGEKAFQTEMHDGYYTYKDGYGISKAYNIKEIIGIGSEYVDTSVDFKVYLFKCTVAYVNQNNEAGSFDVAVMLDIESNNAYLEGIFDSFAGSTKCMKMFGDYAFSYIGKQEKEISTGCKVINEYEVIYSKKTGSVGDIIVKTDVYGCADKSTINIRDIKENKNGGGAAGTYYHEFTFVGEQENTNKKFTGSGYFAVGGDGTYTSYKLKLDFDDPIMKSTYNDTAFDVIGSTDGDLILTAQNE